MTKETLIAEAKKLPRDERHAIAEALWDTGEDGVELTPEDIAIADARWREMEEHPERSMTLEELKAGVKALSTPREVRT